MDEQEVQDLLYEALLPDALGSLGKDANLLEAVLPFSDAGLLTDDCGLVVYLPSGEEFQVTIVRSK